MPRRTRTSYERDADLRPRMAARIRELRQGAGLTQAQLADGLCTKAAISAIESRTALPSLDLLSRLAERLGVSMSTVFADTADEQRPVLVHIRGVEVDRGRVVVELSDGRIAGVPLTIAGRLLDASIREVSGWSLGAARRSVEWPALGVALPLEMFLEPGRLGDAPAGETRGRPARRVGDAPLDGPKRRKAASKA